MLETERLILRPGLITDAQDMYNLNLDPDVVRYTGDSSNKTILEAEQIIKDRLIPQYEKYRMGRFTTLLKDGTYLGWCGLRYFPETDEVDLGYRFMKKFWGKGYATESSKIILKYGFETLKLNRIIAKAMPDNIDSIKVMQKLGMTFKGLYQDPHEPMPLITYELTREQYNTCAES